jgi:hypothetical protein
MQALHMVYNIMVAMCVCVQSPWSSFITRHARTHNLQVRTLSETVRLDARTKLLNPKWYEGMLSSGYEGVREIQKRLTNTMGWSATSGMVDNWVYDEANSTFIEVGREVTSDIIHCVAVHAQPHLYWQRRLLVECQNPARPTSRKPAPNT